MAFPWPTISFTPVNPESPDICKLWNSLQDQGTILNSILAAIGGGADAEQMKVSTTVATGLAQITNQIQVPANKYWRIKSICFSYDTSAPGADRTFYLGSGDGTGVMLGPFIVAPFVQSKATSQKWCFGSQGNDNQLLLGAGLININSVAMPDLIITAGNYLQIMVSGTGAGDVFTAASNIMVQYYQGIM